MTSTIRRVAVLGAGTMGAAIAAHCANAGLPVYLLDLAPDRLTPEEEARGLSLEHPAVRNRIVRAGFERMVQARPPNLFSPATADLITLGNFADNFAWVGEADWIVEAIVERLEPKRELLARVEAVRKPGSIVSSNTSGIPLHQIAAGRSEEFRRHFLGTHFFNPPRYLKLLEVIPTADTGPAVVERVRAFAQRVLGKGVVVTKDTPNFIANRLGSYGMAAIRRALEQGFTVEEVDALTGPLVGRPKTATFRLADLAGLDIMVGVNENLYQAVPHDESRAEFRTPPQLRRMLAAGRLGNKTGAGFYRAVERDGKREFWVIDFETLEYRPPRPVTIPWLAEAERRRDLGERLRFVFQQADAGDRYARFVEQNVLGALGYAARRVPEISDDLVSVDDALRWGYAHQLGPFEIWDALGVAETAARMERQGIAVAPWVKELLAGGHTSFYRRSGGQLAAYHPITKRYEPVRRDPDWIDLAALKAAGRELAGNRDASLIDLGDGVLCLEFHSKANTIGQQGFALLDQALTFLASDDAWQALVIGNQGEYFSAGVNLREVGELVMARGPEALPGFLKAGHDLLQRLRFSPKPVVAAPFGQTRGLGVEIALACAGICAEGELYLGLVEVGAGLIPAGGGCKELVRRIVSPPMRVPGTDPLPFLRQVFETIGQAKVSTSAVEARDLGFLGPNDRIVLGRDRLIAAAKRMALGLAEGGYRPPVPGKSCYAAGRPALANLLVGIHQLKVGGFISEYDAEIGARLARVLCGGDLSAPQWVSEEYFLALEREAFFWLLQQPKTQERILHLLQTGKPLRN